jgi:hypothetical protein
MPFSNKEELETQMPALKKKFLYTEDLQGWIYGHFHGGFK